MSVAYTMNVFYFQQNSNNLIVKPDDVLISYLPLAHSYERLCEVSYTSCQTYLTNIYLLGVFGLQDDGTLIVSVSVWDAVT